MKLHKKAYTGTEINEHGNKFKGMELHKWGSKFKPVSTNTCTHPADSSHCSPYS